MAVFKCKMCGGALEVAEGLTVCECEYCGTQQTLPKTGNEQYLNLINRANHFRQQCEFDKAAEIYEKIAAQSDSDAEVFWSLVLCRYGIEYVDDPVSKKKIATCHRTQYRSVLDDPDYRSALEHADMMQRSVYEREAAYIDMVQKGILEISNKEEPFDVFICYKETDENGRRTPDSVLAQELYYGLVQEGFKVFFSRITLENKLGTEYEPYIFAALNSAKVMVVVGTKPEYFNAVWVKNEWSRYLMLMQEDRSRTLIPAYKEMDPYDLPDALSMFQAQDMSKLGFMQDLIHGIRKIAKNEPEVTERPMVQQTVVHTAVSSNIENLLKRGYLSLEDGEWDDARRFFDEVLNENVEEYRAYIGLLCAEYEISDESKLAFVQYCNDNDSSPFIKSNQYIKACRFGGAEIEKRLYGYYLEGNYDRAESMKDDATTVAQLSEVQKLFSELGDYKDSSEKIQECEQLKLKIRYNDAVRALNNAHTEIECIDARTAFASLGDLFDSKLKVLECDRKAVYTRKDNIYNEAKEWMEHLRYEEDVNKAITLLESISDFKDSFEMLQKCRDRLEEFAEAERKRKTQEKNKKNKIIKTIIGAVVALVLVGVAIVIGKSVSYNNAVEFYEKGNNEEAYELFSKLGRYKDSYTYTLKLCSVGDRISFGKYKWIVYEKNDSTVKLLSQYTIGQRKYNNEHNYYNDVTWENCDLRKWLNNKLYNGFTDEEKSMITETTCNNKDNAEYETTGGNDTKDKVFLLSIDEANKLSKDILECGSQWWLRSPAPGNGNCVWGVNSDGGFTNNYTASSGGVRPALNLEY